MRRVNEQAAGGEWNAGCFRLVPYGSTSRVALYAAHDDDVCFKRLVDTTLCAPSRTFAPVADVLGMRELEVKKKYEEITGDVLVHLKPLLALLLLPHRCLTCLGASGI